MTRINCIAVQDLTDQHLFIEYREITRVSKLARGLIDYGTYTLGEGHVKFFYDKGIYLYKRCEDLYQELIKRGYNPTYKQYKAHGGGLNNDWEPQKADKTINLVRLSAKVVERQNFYTFNKQKVQPHYYIQFIKSL